MTTRQAMTIALSELGLGKREIRRRLDFADREAGWNGNRTITPQPGSTDRDIIEAIKASYLEAIRSSYRRFRALPEEQQAKIFSDLQDVHRRRIAGN